MRYSLKWVFFTTTWIAWCTFAFSADRAWVYELTELIAWFLLSLTLAAPFYVTGERHRRFWTTYSVTSTAFLLLIATGNEALKDQIKMLANRLLDLHVALFGNDTGLSNVYLKSNILATLLMFHSVPVFGVMSGLLWDYLTRGQVGDLMNTEE